MTGFNSKRAMSRDRFAILCEDPFYDEDGVLIDEDADWEDIEIPVEDLSPYITINS